MSTLTTEDGVIEYLRGTSFKAKSIKVLVGHSSVVFKHAEGHSALYPTLPFSTDRFAFEYQALVVVRNAELLKNNIVHIPDVFYCDHYRHVLIIEDAGSVSSLKDFLISNPSTNTAAEIGSALGKFLADLHIWGKDNPQLFSTFSGSQTAREVAAWRASGRLVETAQEFDIALPDLNLGDIAKEMSQEIMQSQETFTMGDFWTGNILVNVDPQSGKLKALFVVDWELAKYGEASSDVAQFAAETLLLARLRSPKASSELLSAFLEAYREKLPGVDAFATALQMGAHMAVLGARVWGGKEECATAVREGFSLVKAGYLKDFQSLSTGPLKELVV